MNKCYNIGNATIIIQHDDKEIVIPTNTIQIDIRTEMFKCDSKLFGMCEQKQIAGPTIGQIEFSVNGEIIPNNKSSLFYEYNVNKLLELILEKQKEEK